MVLLVVRESEDRKQIRAALLCANLAFGPMWTQQVPLSALSSERGKRGSEQSRRSNLAFFSAADPPKAFQKIFSKKRLLLNLELTAD